MKIPNRIWVDVDCLEDGLQTDNEFLGPDWSEYILTTAIKDLPEAELRKAGLVRIEGVAPTLSKLQKDIGEWADEEFGEGDRIIPALHHLKKEIDELLENPIDCMEYADCLMLLLDAARMAKIDADQLKFFCNQKLKTNKKRK